MHMARLTRVKIAKIMIPTYVSVWLDCVEVCNKLVVITKATDFIRNVHNNLICQCYLGRQAELEKANSFLGNRI